MRKLAYPRFIWKSHRGFALFSMLFIAGMQFLAIRIVTAFDVKPIIQAILEQLPEQARLFMAEAFLTQLLSVNGAAAFMLNHPAVLALLAVNAMLVPSRHLAGEIESGTLELLLSLPLRRKSFILRLWGSGAGLLLAIVFMAWCGSLAGVAVWHNLTVKFALNILKIGINLWFLGVVIMTYTLLLSTFSREAGKAISYAAAITLVFYLLNFLSRFLAALAITQPINIFTYYRPQELALGQSGLITNAAVLGMATVVLLTASLWQFQRRDIPG